MAAPVVNQATRESMMVADSSSLETSPTSWPLLFINWARTRVVPGAITSTGTKICWREFGAIVTLFKFSI